MTRTSVLGQASNFPAFDDPEAQALFGKVGMIINRAGMCEMVLASIYAKLCGGAAAFASFSSLISFDAKIDQMKAVIRWNEYVSIRMSSNPEFAPNF